MEFFSGPYFPVFSPNTRKYGPEKTPYLDRYISEQINDWFLYDRNLRHERVVKTPPAEMVYYKF